jgi:hypothetical protein
VLGAIGRDLGMTVILCEDTNITPEQASQGKRESRWLLMAKNPDALGAVAAAGGTWTELVKGDPKHIWTDAHSNILSVLRW